MSHKDKYDNPWMENIKQGDRSADQRTLPDPLPFFVKYAYDVTEGIYRCPKCKGITISVHESGIPMFCGKHTGRMICPEPKETYVEGLEGRPVKGKIISDYPSPEVINGCNYIGNPERFGKAPNKDAITSFFGKDSK